MHLKIKNYQFLIFSSVVRMICTLIATYIFTNFLSVKDFALYNILLSLSIILSGLITSPQYYFLATNQNKSKLLFSTRENINFILCIFVVLIFILYFFRNLIFIENETILFFALFSLSISLAIQIVIQNISRIEKNYSNYFKISIVERVFLIIIIFFSLIFKIKLEIFLLVFSLSCLIFFISYLIKKKYLQFNFDFLKNKSILKESTHAFLYNIVTISIGFQSLIFISSSLNQYIFINAISIGLLFLSLASLPLAWIETIVGPVISRIIVTKNNKLLNNFVYLNFRSVLFFCYIISILLIFFSSLPNVFEFFFKNYSDYKDVVFILAFLLPVMGSKIYLSWFLVCLKKTKYILFSNILVLVSLILIFFHLKFDIREYLFYYILVLLLEIILIYSLFTHFYKIKNVIEIYLILLLTILNLFFYNFFSDIYFFYIYVNLIYIALFLKKNNLKLLFNLIKNS